MTVTAIEKTKRGRFSVFVEGEFFCALHAEVFAASTLAAGEAATPEYLEELRRLSEERIARDRALRLLAGRSYTGKGLYDKLRERADEDAAAAAVERMRELGFVDDADYARRCAADCRNLKGFSRSRTAQELLRRGIDRELVDETLREWEEDPRPAIAQVIRRKYLRYLDDEKGRNKTANALARLGYRYGDIHAVIGNLMEDENYYEE